MRATVQIGEYVWNDDMEAAENTRGTAVLRQSCVETLLPPRKGCNGRKKTLIEAIRSVVAVLVRHLVAPW